MIGIQERSNVVGAVNRNWRSVREAVSFAFLFHPNGPISCLFSQEKTNSLWGTEDAETKVPSVEIPELSKVISSAQKCFCCMNNTDRTITRSLQVQVKITCVFRPACVFPLAPL